MSRSTLLINILVTISTLVISSRIVQANPITYIFSGIGTGVLGNTHFNNQPFALTFVGDTTNIVAPSTDINENLIFPSTTIVVGSTTTTANWYCEVFVNRANALVGVGGGMRPVDLFALADPGFSTYALASAFGPMPSVTPAYTDIGVIGTVAGSLQFSNVSRVSFQAITVPESGSISLMVISGVGLLGAITIKRYRRNILE